MIGLIRSIKFSLLTKERAAKAISAMLKGLMPFIAAEKYLLDLNFVKKYEIQMIIAKEGRHNEMVAIKEPKMENPGENPKFPNALYPA